MQKSFLLLIYIILCLCLLGFSYANAQPIEGKVVNVIDGNTLEIKSRENGFEIIKLWGVDCPEEGQQFWAEAKEYLADLVRKRKITIEFKSMDRDGFRLALVTLKDEPVNVKLVENGYAWAEKHYAKNFFASKEQMARNNSIGLWKHDQPTPPWIYRRQQSMKMAKGL